ncbi:MAG: PAS domain-containing protein [Limisphaerales bacterium]
MEEFQKRIPAKLANSDDAIVITDPEGHTLWVNGAFTRLCGYEVSELKGRKPGSLLQGGETNGEVVETMRHAIRAGIGCVVDLVNYRKNGEPYTVHIQIKPVRRANGNITYFAAVEREFTPEEIGSVGHETIELALHGILEELIHSLEAE